MNTQANKKADEISARSRGFTIIEVVLVLAIAALIFLMIFIALPALQRGQRDTARKNDASAMASALNTYRSNSNGKLPTAGTEFSTFVSQYVDNLSQYAPDTDVVTGTPGSGGATGSLSALTESNMLVILGENCKGTNSSRAASVYVKLESGNGATPCTDA